MARLLLMLSDFVSLPLPPTPPAPVVSPHSAFSPLICPSISLHFNPSLHHSLFSASPSLTFLSLQLSLSPFISVSIPVPLLLWLFYLQFPSSSIPTSFLFPLVHLLFFFALHRHLFFSPLSLSLSCPPSHPLLYLCHYPSLPVTIAAVPSIRPRFPVAWLPRSPSRSLAPSLRRTAGRRCTAPPPPSPTGRGNESPRQLRALGVRVCVCESPRTSGVKFDSLRVRQCESVKQPCVSPLTCIVMMYMEYNWTSVLFSVEHSGPECCCGCKMYQCFKLPLQMSHRGPVKRRPAAAVHEMMLLFEGI